MTCPLRLTDGRALRLTDGRALRLTGCLVPPGGHAVPFRSTFTERDRRSMLTARQHRSTLTVS